MMFKRELMTSLLVGISSFVGCSTPTDVPPFIVGTISEVQQEPFMILVMEASEVCGAWFSVDGNTSVRASSAGNSTSTVSRDALKVGMRVSVWADGDVLLSCPARGRAASVLIGA
jgi:hypothetical protein